MKIMQEKGGIQRTTSLMLCYTNADANTYANIDTNTNTDTDTNTNTNTNTSTNTNDIL